METFVVVTILGNALWSHTASLHVPAAGLVHLCVCHIRQRYSAAFRPVVRARSLSYGFAPPPRAHAQKRPAALRPWRARWRLTFLPFSRRRRGDVTSFGGTGGGAFAWQRLPSPHAWRDVHLGPTAAPSAPPRAPLPPRGPAAPRLPFPSPPCGPGALSPPPPGGGGLLSGNLAAPSAPPAPPGLRPPPWGSAGGPSLPPGLRRHAGRIRGRGAGLGRGEARGGGGVLGVWELP